MHLEIVNRLGITVQKKHGFIITDEPQKLSIESWRQDRHHGLSIYVTDGGIIAQLSDNGAMMGSIEYDSDLYEMARNDKRGIMAKMDLTPDKFLAMQPISAY